MNTFPTSSSSSGRKCGWRAALLTLFFSAVTGIAPANPSGAQPTHSSPKKVRQDAPASFDLTTPIVTTSPDYAYDFTYGGQTFHGTATLQPGQNTVPVTATLPDGTAVQHEFNVSLVDSLIATQGFSYDEMQRIKTFRNGNGIVSTFNYDLGGRLTSITATNGSKVSFTYDPAGRRTSMADSSGYTFYDWDDLDRLVAVTTSKTSSKTDASALQVRYGYDLAGRRTSITYPGGEQVVYTFDSANRMTSVTNVTLNQKTTYEYNSTSGLLTAVNRANGIRTVYSYDGMARVTDILHSKGGALVAEYSYALNASGNATQLTIKLPGGVTQVEQYSYDDLDELTQVIYADGRQLNYAYSPTGNRLALTTRQNGAVTGMQNYSYGNDNRLLQITDQAGALVARFSYDSAGNRVQKVTPGGTTYYVFDERNLLIAVITPTDKVSYLNNGVGQRVGRTVNGVATQFVLDGNNSDQIVQERSGTNITASYTYAKERLSVITSNPVTQFFPLEDRLGSVQELSNAAGEIAGSFKFDAFGEAFSGSPTASAYSFAGGEFNNEAGLIYFRSRYYDPKSGQFVSKDSLGVAAGLNMYAYCGANPVNRLDRTGFTSQNIGQNIVSEYQSLSDAINGVPDQRHLNQAVSPQAFLSATDGKSFWQVRNEANPDDYGFFSASGPNEDVRYFTDPADPSKVIDGRHFLGVGPLGVGYGIGVEIAEGINEIFHAPSDPSAFKGEDFHSNGPGSEYFDNYYAPLSVANNFISGLNSIGDVFGADEAFGTTLSKQDVFHDTLSQYFEDRAAIPSVGGVLLDKAAQLIGSNLTDIIGATYDPVSKQIVFLGSNNPAAVKDLNLDYFYTATQSIFGSANPPFVTLDPPAAANSPFTVYADHLGILAKGDSGGFQLRYNPIWSGEDTNGGIDIRVRGGEYHKTAPFDFTLHFSAQENANITAGGRHAMLLTYVGVSSGTMPSGITFDAKPFAGNAFAPGVSFSLSPDGQDSSYPFTLTNNSSNLYLVNSVNVIPARQHRKYGGRVDGTKLGWVMYEADRVMKCLGVGRDNITGASYNSTNVAVSGYKNLQERMGSSAAGGAFRFWFEPNQIEMQRAVDPATGQATILFTKSSVVLLTESYLQNVAEDPIAKDFATHFTANYDAFAALSFPVLDPTDPASKRMISVPIFKMLRGAMQAVALARFFRDNNIPLDTWWLNSWQAPVAYSPKSVPSAINASTGTDPFFLLYGGVQIYKPNSYTPSSTAQNVGQSVTTARPDTAAAPGGDLKEQAWNASTAAGGLTAVAGSFQAKQQDASIRLAEVDLNFASPGMQPLRFTRYYQSGYLGHQSFGPGWRYTRYALEFNRPSWYDEQHLMHDAKGNALTTDTHGDTRLRSGAVRLVDLATGTTLDFDSSLRLDYAVDSRGNPAIAVSGLSATGVPAFTAGKRQNGAALVQTPGSDEAFRYQANLPDGSQLFFDSEGRLLQTFDRHGYKLSYNRNSGGDLTDIADQAGQDVVLTYATDGTGLIKSIVGPAGEEVDYDYDTSSRLVKATHKRSNASTAYTYSDSGQLVGKTRFDGSKAVAATLDLSGRSNLRNDPRGNTSVFGFFQDASTKARATTSAVSGSNLSASQRNFDSLDRVTAVLDPLKNWTIFGYASDSSLYPSAVYLPTPDRPAIQITRNAAGFPTQVDDPAVPGAQPLQFAYTAANRPYWQKDALGRQTMLGYTDASAISQITRYLNGQSVTTSMSYSNGRVSAIIDPLKHSTAYLRDSLGRVTGVVDPTGVTIGFEFDELGRLSAVNDPRITGKVSYVYDTFDGVTDIKLPAGTIHFDYDPSTHRLSKVIDVQGRTTRYVYSDVGDLVQTIKDTSSGSLVTKYDYTRFGALSQVTLPDGSIIYFQTDDLNRTLGSSESNSAHLGAPKNLRADNASDGVYSAAHGMIFSWGAPDSDVGVAGYSYALDAAPANAINTAAGIAAVAGVRDGRHIFSVKAQDKSGQWGDVAAFRLNIGGPDGYAGWLAKYFSPAQIADSSVTGEAADPDGDRIPNLAEYGLGGDPLVADVSPLPVSKAKAVGGAKYLAVQYRRRIAAPDIVYITEVSQDGTNWTAVDSSLNQIGNVRPIDGEFEKVKVRGNDPLPDGDRQTFIRLRIAHQ